MKAKALIQQKTTVVELNLTGVRYEQLPVVNDAGLGQSGVRHVPARHVIH